VDPSISRAMQRDTEKRVHKAYIHTYIQAVLDFRTQLFREKLKENRNVRKSSNRHMLQRGFRYHYLKVHKNPYLLATNKTVVATIKVQ